MGLTLQVPPGFSDLSDSALVANSPTLGLDLLKIYDNAVFGLVRPEIFISWQVNGDTVALPVSPIDGYAYKQSELTYMWGIRETFDDKSGWITGLDSLWYFACYVDQATGKVFMDTWYRRSGSHYDGKHTNDGKLIVYTIAQRQKSTLVMASSPSYSAITGSTVAQDKPLTQLLAQALNDDAKFAVVDHEVFYLGEYTHGQTVTLPISPADGYHYSAAECKFQFSWRWTPPGASPMAAPSLSDGQLAPIQASVNSSGVVSITIYYVDDGGNLISFNDGRVAVFAFCQRSGTPGSISPTANSFAELSFDDFMPGSPLPYTLIQQMINNTQEALLAVEFFGPTAYGDGSTIALPTSPIDGYAYSRSELYYLYEWSDTTNQTGTHLRVPLFVARDDVLQATGNVQLEAWRLPPGGPYIDDNNSLCRINVLTVARRAAQAAGSGGGGGGTTPPNGTVPVDTAWFYQKVEQAGTAKPPEVVLNFLDPITATDDSGNQSTDIAVPDMTGATTGSPLVAGKHGLVPAPGAGDAVAGKFLKADGTWEVPGGTAPYAIAFDMGGGRTTPPATGESLLRHKIASDLTQVALPTGLTGSYAECRTASTGAYSITIKKNGSSIGSINFTAGNTTGAFTFSSPQTLVPGDLVEFVGGTADTSILGIYFTISGLRS